MAIPRYRAFAGPVIFSAGFRPFFLAAAFWAAIAVPLWLAVFAGDVALPSVLPPPVWHAHEMVFGYAAASVAGFLLTAIPNWTGRMPLQGGPLAVLTALWAAGRLAVWFSTVVGAPIAAIADLAFPVVFVAAVAREIVTGRNWRNLPIVAALSVLLAGNVLVHLEALGIADTAAAGNRLGIATLVTLISIIGGRIVPSFTHNWLAKNRADAPSPRTENRFDRAVLVLTPLALAVWVAAPETSVAALLTLIAGAAAAVRLSRWRGVYTTREPLVLVLHAGYGWLAAGLMLLGVAGLADLVPATAALHALTVGAIGTMTLGVMTRVSLGHTGRSLTAGAVTTAIYLLVTMAAILRVVAQSGGSWMMPLLWAAGAAWTAAFGLFVLFYGAALARPRAQDAVARPI